MGEEQNGGTRDRVIANEMELKSLEKFVQLFHSDLKTQLNEYQNKLSSEIKEVKALLSEDHDQLVKNTQNIAMINRAIAIISTALAGLLAYAAKSWLGF